jgi:DnaJ homolog subfamily A member 5
LWNFFNNGVYENFGDNDEKGFYRVYSNVFQTVYEEEKDFVSKSKNVKKPPSFGDSKTSYDEAILFYTYWSSFTTIKSYGWVDQHKPQDAPNRITRRYVEQENQKTRDSEKKKYNELVRKLASYVRKRDPRILKHEEEQRKQKEKREEEKLKKV